MSIFQTTKRPPTAGFNFKNSIIALVERLATKVTQTFNLLPDDKILDWSKLKEITGNIFKCI